MTYQHTGSADTKRRSTMRRLVALGLVAASGGLLASACADNESSLFIRACLARKPPDCSVEADPEAEFFSHGRFDLAYASSYSCPLLVGNQVVDRGDSDTLRTETSRITLYAADVRVTDQAGGAIDYPDGGEVAFNVPISGFVDPGTGTDPGYGIADVLLVDTLAAQAIGASIAATGPVDLMANVVVYGRTLGGQEIESGEWSFPFSVCIACACTEPADDTCPCADPMSPTCVPPMEAPDTEICDANGSNIDCRFGSRFGGGTCAEVATAAVTALAAGGP